MLVFQSSLRPRNPLVRLIGGILGLIVVLGLVALGFFAFIALFIGGAIWYLVHLLRAQRPRRPQAQTAKRQDGVIDGEFTVIGDTDHRIRIELPDRDNQQQR